MKKILLKLFSLVVCVLLAFGMVACGGGDDNKIQSDGKTINVKVYNGGYGTAWLYQLKEKFEKVYKSEGYKVNILTPQEDLKGGTALGEIAVSGGADLYFVQSVSLSDVLTSKGKVLVKDISDVYGSKAIKFDGTEEDVTIASKLPLSYESSVKDGDKYYSMLWANSPSGLVVNKEVLAKYDLELPRTTDELFNCFDAIYNGNGKISGSDTTGVYPMSIPNGNAYGYGLYPLYTYLGQMLGQAEYEKFMSLNCDATSANAFYEGTDIYASIENIMKMYNSKTALAGSKNKEAKTSQADILQGRCAFICDGECFVSEVSGRYDINSINKITYINFPVCSQLGVKLGITDAELSEVIAKYDEGKAVDNIVNETGVSLDKVNKIIEARNCFYERIDLNTYIPIGSSVSDISELFLRMMASDDFGDLFNSTAKGYAPYSLNNNVTSEYEYINKCFEAVSKDNSWGVSNLHATGDRKKKNIKIYTYYGSDICKLSDVSDGITFEVKDVFSNTNYLKVVNNINSEFIKLYK